MSNPYQSPAAAVTPDAPMAALQYGGFWRRVGASIIDSILILLVTSPVLYAFYGDSFYTEQSMLRGPRRFRDQLPVPRRRLDHFLDLQVRHARQDGVRLENR